MDNNLCFAFASSWIELYKQASKENNPEIEGFT